MSTIESELKDLQAAQAKIDADIANANKTLQDAQSKLSTANGQRTSLATKIAAAEKLAKDLDGTRGANKALREKIQMEMDSAKKTVEELQARLFNEIPEERRAAITASVDKVNAAIGDAQTTFANAHKETQAGEAAAAAAKQKAAAAEAEYQKANGELQQQPKKIEAARSRVSKLTSDVKAALDAGRFNEAFLFFLQLKQGLAELPNLISKDNEDKLAGKVMDTRSASQAAQTELAKATESLTAQKAKEATAEAEAKKKEQQREADLKAALSATAPAPQPPPKAENATGQPAA
jgi:chromosome segregation ATPase